MFKITTDDIRTFKDIRILSRKMKLFFDKEIKPKQTEFNREYKHILSLIRIVQWVKKKRKGSIINRIDFWFHAINREGIFYTLKMLFGGEKYAFLDLARDYWGVKRDIKILDSLENTVEMFTEEAEKIYFDKTLTEENKYVKFYETLKRAEYLHEELLDVKDELDEMGEIDKYAKN
jgi:hypothetical protein